MFITILTPTFNRGYILNKLYASLKAQTDQDFEWLIVDDGSTDETGEIVKKYIDERIIRIRYLWKSNGGKHTALNFGIKQIESQWTMIVDSDDYLKENAVERIKYYSKKINTYSSPIPLCGMSFYRQFPDGRFNGKIANDNEFISNFMENRINSNDRLADKAEVYLTNILKQYPFPTYGNEKFLQENIVWIQISFEYNMVFLNEAIYVGDYLNDGLTKNIINNKLHNPIGMYHNAQLLMDRRFSLYNRVKGAVLYDIYYQIAHKSFSGVIKRSGHRFYSALAIIPSIVIAWYYKRKLRKND